MQQKQHVYYYNDIDPYCCALLRERIATGALPQGVVDERDIRLVQSTELMAFRHIHLFAGLGGFPLGLSWVNFPAHLRIITGGFPCQDISHAGRRTGIDGARSGLWREMCRLICEVRPQYVIVENVAALLVRGIDRVLADLAACGYDAEWQVLPAAAFGAPHRRERVFLVAYPNGQRWDGRGDLEQERQLPRVQEGQDQPESFGQETQFHPLAGGQAQVADANGPRLPGGWKPGCVPAPEEGICTPGVFERGSEIWATRAIRADCWAVEPDVGRVVDGLPYRVDRIKALGNAIVPQIVAYVGRCIMAHEQQCRRRRLSVPGEGLHGPGGGDALLF
jgi:DNA (cytosine-5)-methyltransferase 1